MVHGLGFMVLGSWFFVHGCSFVTGEIIMTSIQRFEEIEAWQKARELTRAIYQCSRERRFARDYGLCDQIRKAAVSIMSNIAA
jgi:hypothetical protein